MTRPPDDEGEARSRLTEAQSIGGEWTRADLLAEAQVLALLAAVAELRRIRRRT